MSKPLKRYSFLIRILFIITVSTICLSLLIGLFTTNHKLEAKLHQQRIELAIKDAIIPSAIVPSPEPAAAAPAAPVVEEKVEDVKPAISILMIGLGLSKSITEEALNLPSVINVGFSPYVANIAEYLAQASSKGHEVLVNLPLQTKNYPSDDPGPLALLNDLSNVENFERLETILKSSPNYVGIYSLNDDVFSESVYKMEPILRYLQDKNLLYVYAGPSTNQAIWQLTSKLNYKLMNVDVILDEDASEEYIKGQLDLLKKIALEKGTALALANPYPITINILNEWLPNLEKTAINIVPITVLHKN